MPTRKRRLKEEARQAVIDAALCGDRLILQLVYRTSDNTVPFRGVIRSIGTNGRCNTICAVEPKEHDARRWDITANEALERIKYEFIT